MFARLQITENQSLSSSSINVSFKTHINFLNLLSKMGFDDRSRTCRVRVDELDMVGRKRPSSALTGRDVFNDDSSWACKSKLIFAFVVHSEIAT